MPPHNTKGGIFWNFMQRHGKTPCNILFAKFQILFFSETLQNTIVNCLYNAAAHMIHNQTDTQQEPMQEPVSVSVSIQTDKDTRKSMDHVSEQERQEPLCLSCLGVPFRHSRNRAILGHLKARGIIPLWKRLRGIQRHCTACTGYSESVILSDMAGTSKQTATIRPTPNKDRTAATGDSISIKIFRSPKLWGD